LQRAAAATDNSSILHETAKDEALHPVAVGMLDISKGEILVETPIDIQCSSKKTVVQCIKIVSQELGNEDSLASKGNHLEAEDEELVADKETMEGDTSDVNERTIDESTNPDGPQHRNQDNNNVDAQAAKFDMLEAPEAKTEDKEGEAQGVSDMENLETVNEDKYIKIEAETGILDDESTNDIDSISGADPSGKDSTMDLASPIAVVPEDPVAEKLERDKDKHVKIEAETGICSDDKTNDTDSIPVEEPSEKKNTQEPFEETAEEDIEPAKEVPEDPEEEKLEKVTEDTNVKIGAETTICNDERTNGADGIPAAEPSNEEDSQETLEITTKKDLEPAEDVPESCEHQNPLDAVPEEPEASMLPHQMSCGVNEKHETETTSEEEVVVNVEESSPEDEKKYEPIKKVESGLPPEYQVITY